MQLFVNDLTVMDFSYLCPERGMVGESWIVDVLLDGACTAEWCMRFWMAHAMLDGACAAWWGICCRMEHAVLGGACTAG